MCTAGNDTCLNVARVSSSCMRIKIPLPDLIPLLTRTAVVVEMLEPGQGTDPESCIRDEVWGEAENYGTELARGT